MNEIIYTDAFIEDMKQIYTERVRADVFDTIDLLPSMPILGSADLPSSIVKYFGADVRKMAVSPFLVIYKIVGDGDFLILGLMPERSAF